MKQFQFLKIILILALFIKSSFSSFTEKGVLGILHSEVHNYDSWIFLICGAITMVATIININYIY